MQLIPCPACASPLSPAARACPRCGHPLAPITVQATGKSYKAAMLLSWCALPLTVIIAAAAGGQFGAAIVLLNLAAIALVHVAAWWATG